MYQVTNETFVKAVVMFSKKSVKISITNSRKNSKRKQNCSIQNPEFPEL